MIERAKLKVNERIKKFCPIVDFKAQSCEKVGEIWNGPDSNLGHFQVFSLFFTWGIFVILSFESYLAVTSQLCSCSRFLCLIIKRVEDAGLQRVPHAESLTELCGLIFPPDLSGMIKLWEKERSGQQLPPFCHWTTTAEQPQFHLVSQSWVGNWPQAQSILHINY